jgi:hypothetical protein
MHAFRMFVYLVFVVSEPFLLEEKLGIPTGEKITSYD